MAIGAGGVRVAELVCVLTLSSALARAQDPPRTAIVTLRSGGVFQGELVESIPGDHTTLRLATGEIRRFNASDMAPNTTSPSTRLVLGFPAPVTGYSGVDAVKVHVETNKPGATFLQQAAEGGSSIGWNRLCSAPCDMLVDPTRVYRIGGEHIVDSDEFHLRRGGTQTLYVNATSAGVPAMGWISLGLGVAMSAPAVYFVTRPSSHDPGTDENHLVGWILLANGLPWLITGAVILAMGGTTVKNDDGTRLALTRQPPRALSLGHGARLTAHGVEFLFGGRVSATVDVIVMRNPGQSQQHVQLAAIDRRRAKTALVKVHDGILTARPERAL